MQGDFYANEFSQPHGHIFIFRNFPIIHRLRFENIAAACVHNFKDLIFYIQAHTQFGLNALNRHFSGSGKQVSGVRGMEVSRLRLKGYGRGKQVSGGIRKKEH